MYIMVRNRDKLIVGTANSAPTINAQVEQEYTFYEVDESEFSINMIGKTLASFEEDNDTI